MATLLGKSLFEQHYEIGQKIKALYAEQERILCLIQAEYKELESDKEHYRWQMQKMMSDINKQKEHEKE